MKCLTLNCHAWHESEQLAKIDILAKAIVEESIDVIALQEVNQTKAKPILSLPDITAIHPITEDNYLKLLMDAMKKLGVNDYHGVWDISHYCIDYEEGVAILTRFPMSDYEAFCVGPFSEVDCWKTRKILKAKITYHQKFMDVFSCHCGFWEDDQTPFKMQADDLLKQVNRSQATLLLGDFNNSATVRNEGYDYLMQFPLYDTYTLASKKDKGTTVDKAINGWEKNTESLRIDLIFSTDPIYTNSSKVIFNGEFYPVISDHFGVLVDLDY